MNSPGGAPDAFTEAYEGLAALVMRISGGEVREEVLREQVDGWRRERCRGAATLAKAAILALRHELSDEGLREGAGAVAGSMRALQAVEEILEPPEASGTSRPGTAAPVTEGALPEAMRRAAPRARGFRMGELQMIFEPMAGPHGITNAHLSVSHPRRYPTFEELLLARKAPGGETPNLWAWLPKPKEPAPMNRHTVHLYVAPPPDLLG